MAEGGISNSPSQVVAALLYNTPQAEFCYMYSWLAEGGGLPGRDYFKMGFVGGVGSYGFRDSRFQITSSNKISAVLALRLVLTYRTYVGLPPPRPTYLL